MRTPLHTSEGFELENWVPPKPMGMGNVLFAVHEVLALAKVHLPATYAACLIRDWKKGMAIAASIANTATTTTSSSKVKLSFVLSLRAIRGRIGLEYLVIRWSQVLYLSMT